MRVVSRVNMWSCVVCIGLILALNHLAVAEVSSPVSASPPQAAEQDPEVDVKAPADAPPSRMTEQSPEVDIDAPPPRMTKQSPEVDVEAPADVPAPRMTEQSLEVEVLAPAGGSTGEGKQSILKIVRKYVEMDFTLTSGVRKDDFQWSIAGNSAGTNPNVLSELTWSDVDSYQLALTNRTMFKRRFYLRGDLNYAFIQNGRIQDSDYDNDDRSDEYSRSISHCSGDQIWDISLAAGYPFFFFKEQLLVAPLIGLSYHRQNFRITDGEQVLTDGRPTIPDLGPLEGLDSTYRSVWAGPWVGCDLRYRLPGRGADNRLPMEFGFSVGFHYAEYEAEANWNLRSDLDHPVSFEHEADGYGIALDGEWFIGLSEHWDFVFRATYQYWETDDGVDQSYIIDPSDPTHIIIGRTQLNEVEWSNYSFLVGANFHF